MTTSRQVYLRDYVPLPVSLLNTRRIGGTANQVDVLADVTPDLVSETFLQIL